MDGMRILRLTAFGAPCVVLAAKHGFYLYFCVGGSIIKQEKEVQKNE